MTSSEHRLTRLDPKSGSRTAVFDTEDAISNWDDVKERLFLQQECLSMNSHLRD